MLAHCFVKWMMYGITLRIKGVIFYTSSLICNLDIPALISTLANGDIPIAKVNVVNTCFFHFCNF